MLYRSPASKHGSPVLEGIISNFRNVYSKIKAEKPFATFVSFGGLMTTTPEGREIEDHK